MKQKEQELITYLADMSRCLHSHDDWWSEKFNADSIQANNLFNRDAELKDKYDFVRRILSYYESGMGGLHEIVPEECAKTKTVIYESINDLLRRYWRELGREWHDYSNFDIIPDGAEVKLIPSKVIYQRPDYPPTIVPDTEVTKQVWSVLKCQGPDITNMPSYLIKCVEGGSAWRSARQEALEVVANTDSDSQK
jgi:hypothetical protein